MKHLIAIWLLLFCFFFSSAENTQTQLAIGDKAPDFTVQDQSGKPLSLSSLRGKIVLINFWTASCEPCRLNHPDLYRIYNTYKSYGFEVLSVSLDTKKETWVNALKMDRINWPNNGIDLQGWNSKVVSLYGLKSTPGSFLISEEGNILQINQDKIALEQTLHYLIFDQPRFYPVVANTTIYFNVISKYNIVDSKGYSVLKGRAKEVSVAALPPGEYTLTYENKTEKFLKVQPEQTPITFYPTRVEDEITLSREADYYIYNQRGKLEFKGNGTTIDVKKLPLGVYYLCVEGTIHSFFKK
ncbi:redoxin domain-containing protein [Cytophaga hutchinsonii]|jgi:cytochrome oxidase Cu insertion factor (SCO1/SenC/PrrC family)|uniref:Redoxin family protein n=1 Tax=Cytophaga hutchinsonii (strain ATCC 33406 / DSM 1761 / CIP 103989 / NBRC 15051 / NCIMB 9469 / D465) TaxID=269798 RepID=A0A6N4SVL4_CYTH3|nr:redoxin domain-containing protein [Cytophaga hutchinsonii]ABG60467.1 redoxin family protein [Cytophaga hutchinsonii ATCC 33406]SFX85334.1 AhpC/TSA family protein [Cytophaga hutchinsonii ATCC 33406]